MIAISAPAGDCAERWLPVVGYEGRYEVSDQGRVRNAVTQHVLNYAPAKNGYVYATLYSGNGRGRRIAVHQIVLAAFVGPRPDGCQPDHKDTLRANNRLDNLRYLTQSMNNARRVMPHRGGPQSTAFRGVCKTRTLRTFAASIRINGRKTHLGTFDTAEQAARSYDAAARAHHGAFAVLNFEVQHG